MGKLKQIFLNFWHDLYYLISSKKADDFALRCRDVVERIDQGHKAYGTNTLGRLRFYVHLSLCTTCKSYFESTKALKNAIREIVSNGQNNFDIEQLNQDLIKKFASEKN